MTVRITLKKHWSDPVFTWLRTWLFRREWNRILTSDHRSKETKVKFRHGE